MAPAKGRGRPRKAVSLGHSLPDSRSSCKSFLYFYIYSIACACYAWFRSFPGNQFTDKSAIATRRSTRKSLNNLSTSIASSKASASPTVNGDDVSTSDFPSPSMTGEYMDAKKVKADVKGRGSLSSVSTSNDYNDSSGYSTPATSAVATPINEEKTTTSRRGRPPTKMSTLSSGPSLVARAAALRNSKYSLNPNKRKRVPDSDDDEDDADEDNTPDAQLARALQEQEDNSANNMTAMDVDSVTPRRTPRKIQKILPKSDFVTDLSENELDIPVAIPAFSPKLTKRPKIELSSQGSNSVKFTSTKTKKKTVVVETDESNFVESDDDSDEFVEIQDSDAEEEPVAMSTSRSRTKMTVQLKSSSVKKSLPPKFKVPPRPAARPLKPPKSAFGVSSFSKSGPSTLKRENTNTSTTSSALTSLGSAAQTESEFDSELEFFDGTSDSDPFSGDDAIAATTPAPLGGGRRITSRAAARRRINLLENRSDRRGRLERQRLESHHPELHTMWTDLENLPKIGSVRIEQPKNITRELKPFQLEGVAWMKDMEKTDWGGGLLGDEMGMGKTIQAVSLIMSDFPAPQPTLVLIPPVALMQWQQEIEAYTDGTLKTFVYHGTNAQTKGATLEDLMKYNVILMSYNSLESMYRKQEKGFKRKNGLHKEPSVIHQIQFHRVILDEAHNIKVRKTFSKSLSPALTFPATYYWFCQGLLCVKG